MKIIYKSKTDTGELQIVQSKTRYGTRHFWRTTNKKGEQLARSSENFERLQGCLRNLRAEQNVMWDCATPETIASELGIKL